MPRVVAWVEETLPPSSRKRSLASTRFFRSTSSVHSIPSRPRPRPWSAASLLYHINRAWERAQVSRRGEISGARLQALHRSMNRTPRWRIALLWVLTPLPSIGFVIAIHLLPLEPLAAGWKANGGYWLGLGLSVFMIAQNFVTQLSYVIPEIPILIRQQLAISTFSTLVSVLICMVLSELWVFPIPFGIVVLSPLFAIALVFFTTISIGDQARRRLPVLRSKITAYGHIVASQTLLSVLFPAYNAVYVGLESTQQAISVVVPSIIKFGVKNLLMDSCQGLPLDDELPEMMIFTADLFSALYLSACMQTVGSSTLTTFVIIALGNVQLVLAVRNLLRRGKQIRWLLRQLPVQRKRGRAKALKSPASLSNEQLTAIAVRLCQQIGHRSGITMTAASGPRGISAALKSVTAFPQHQILSVLPHAVNAEAQERLVRQILKTLFTCEYIILAEYVKCVVPLCSLLHTVALYYLPAKEYFWYMDQYKDADSLNRAIAQVLLYALSQILSFVALWLVLGHQLRHSAFFHLAFVLEHNREMIQLRLFTWVSYALVLSIAHSGVDFSFHFEWMKSK